MTIQEPHDSGLGVSSDATAEPCTVTLLNNLEFRLGHETGLKSLGFILNQFWSSLPSGFHLPDSLDAGHALGQLRFIDDSRFSGCLQNSTSFIHAVQVGGAADVLAGVLWVHPAKVHGDITKVKDGSETVLWKMIKWEILFD